MTQWRVLYDIINCGPDLRDRRYDDVSETGAFWEIEHFLTVEDGEPTKFYIISRRIAGVIMVCGGIAGILFQMLCA